MMVPKKSKHLKSVILRTMLILFISLTLGSAVYSFNVKTLMGEKMPMPFGIGTGVVLSDSMEPSLSKNDLIFVRKSDSYEVNDVVVYQSCGILVIHRIIAIDGETVTTQGDANNAADDPIPQSAVKGKMIGSIPHVGAVAKVLKSPVAVIVLVAAAIMLWELSWSKEKKSGNEKLNEIQKEIERLKKEVKGEIGQEGSDDESQSK